MGSSRALKIGKIKVIRYEASFSHFVMQPSDSSSKKSKTVNFIQASKKDVARVTSHEYCMATTRQGKLIRQEKPYSRPQPQVQTNAKQELRSKWTIGEELDKLHVEYHMTQTLLDWGIKPTRPGWPLQESTETIVIE